MKERDGYGRTFSDIFWQHQEFQMFNDDSESLLNAENQSTVVGSDSESENSVNSFTLVERKNKGALRKAHKKAKVACNQPVMDTDASPAPSTNANDAQTSPTVAQSTQSPTDWAIKINTGSKPNVPPKLNHHYRSFWWRFHTYALEEERKIKAVLRGIPVRIDTEDVKTDLTNRGFPVHSVHQIQRSDGTSVGFVLAVLYKTDEIKNMFKNISKICGLSNIRAEVPYKRGGPEQCHSCQRYVTGHVAANCYVQPRCVKCLIPHWTNECSLTKEQEEKPSCMNCSQNHTANYRGRPKASKLVYKKLTRLPKVRTHV
ncbi:Nucleic-acid-binding protein from transposon X-element [Eumeta japonica]|uniref:Nucleic-acid-binding protein from transposon X-element n=1 Tax=Eumeta variegata TaxID=151549 RepID=A0A4C1XP22_EUMVA|nr:Nucleic-acid-binding protein from transposon X-element [Eumeta japonica]